MTTPLSERILQELVDHRLAGVPIDEQMIAPHYEGLGIANLPASIAGWLGAEWAPGLPLDRRISGLFEAKYRNVVLVVVDALGWEQFQHLSTLDTLENKALSKLLADSKAWPLTSVVPSTTASALSTFWSGVTPSTHGIMGYEMWLQEYSLTANMILQTPASFLFGGGTLASAGFAPGQFLNVETFGSLLKRQGISSYSLQPEMIADSGLSQSLMPDVEHLPYESLAELWQTLETKLSERSASQRYYFAYWPNLDGVQHTYGPQHPFVAQEYFGFLRELIPFLERARHRGKGDTLLLLTADHGMLATELSPEVEIRRYPELLSMMHLLPTGEARMPYLYLKPGFEQKALALIESIFPGQFIPIDSQKALDAGLFGPAPYHPQAIQRLGDVVLLARGNHYLYWQNKESTMHGRHGGLSSTEMLVPLLAFPL